MKKIIAILFLLILKTGYPQNNREIDSLKTIINSGKQDTIEIIAINKLGWKYITMGQYDTAFAYSQKALSLAKKLNYKKGLAKAYSNIGHVYNYKGDYNGALKNHLISLNIKKEINDKQGIASSYNNIGIIYENESNNPKALQNFLQSLKITQEIGDKKGIANAYGNIGTIYKNTGNYTEALKNFLLTKKIAEEMNDKKIVGASLGSIGNIFMLQKKYPEALNYYFLEARIMEELNIAFDMATVYHNIGLVYIEQKKLSEALTFLNRALKIREEIGDKEGISSSLLFIGNVFFIEKKYEEALTNCTKSLAISKKSNSVYNIQQANQLLSDIYASIGKNDLALKYFKDFVDIREIGLNEENTKKIVRLEMNYEFEKKQQLIKSLQDKKDALFTENNKIKELEISRGRYIAFGLVFVVIFVVCFAILFLRQNKLQSNQNMVQLEQKLLRSQMNPHFIFNSLQAIQNFILKNDQKEAVKYLSSFANITRSVLENSRLEEISLKKEISLLENYLQLQKLRFGDRFDYNIHVDPEIDLENIKIPPMLSQPFIENALEHGMKDIDSGGIIDIYIALKNNLLLLEIKDNGNGIGPDSIKEHQSLATTITKERITLMNKNKLNKIIFSITEAYPNEKRKGVKVNFSIPV